MAAPVYNTRAWKAVRPYVLQRDQYRCQIKGPRCEGAATDVDHIVPIARGGSWYDPSNLRAACRRCNSGRGAKTGSGSTKVILVAGAPGSGKSTYVEQHKHDGDLVVDYDVIAQALGSPTTHDHDNHAAVMAARGGLLDALKRGKVTAPRAWVVSSNPKADALFMHDELVVVDPGIDEVRRRAAQAGRPARWQRLIGEWYVERSGGLVGPSEAW